MLKSGYLAVNSKHQAGIGMTSQRTRDRLITRLEEKGITNDQVLEAMRMTPRHLFVDEALASRAYEDTALPIGHKQTISQPYVVARMTEAIIKDGIPKKVLEVGTGSGYQGAILAALIKDVYTVERVEPLYQQARRRAMELGIRNIRFKLSDGAWGWESYAPYDAIVVTAAPKEIPDALIDQLGENGRLVIPVGKTSEVQDLMLLHKTKDGIIKERLDGVSFVPLIQGSV
ncbi:MAG: protein-L-isoaspartate(D-aspartate) O-methyltransferase [Gammaproteobacteria bacterium]|nr:MAG: protein-L-isoaspartate(D-aspartate) O-methyltransferase [Gammaproteobacteria bacterium]